MADIAGAFIRGHQAGQFAVAHEQEQQENKLRQQVLKHEIDRLKIEDQLRAREVALQHAAFMQGLPLEDQNPEAVTTQQPNLPSRSLAGMMTGPMGPSGPSTIQAPAAQMTQPGTNPVTTMRPAALTIPGVDGMAPPVSVRPQSLEDLIAIDYATRLRNAAFTKMAPGEVVPALGTQPPAGPRMQSVGAGGLAEIGPDGSVKQVVPPRQTPQRPVIGKPGDSIIDPTTGKVTGRVPGESESAKNSRETRAFNQQFKQYQAEVAAQQKQHDDAFKVWMEKMKNPLSDPSTLGEPPTFTPPTFDQWKEQNGLTEGGGETPAPKGPKGKTGKAGGVAASGATFNQAKSFLEKAGVPTGAFTTAAPTIKLRSGKTIKVTTVYPDGSFDGTEVQ